MNKLFISLLYLFFFFHLNLFSNNKVEKTVLTDKAQHYLKNQSVKFLENKGQMTDMAGKPVPFVLFKAEAPSVDLYITEKGLTYVLLKIEKEASPSALSKGEGTKRHEEENIKIEWNRIDMVLKGASIKKENVIKESKSTYFKQYFLAHCPDGIKDVHDYEKITIKNIYPNIDWILYNSNEKGFKYDFIVHPGANAKDIEMLYASENPIKIDQQGELRITSKLGTITENAPVSFLNGQEIKTQFKQVGQTKIKINGNKGYETVIRFDFPNTDVTELTNDLVIDPQLVWGTFFGGNNVDAMMAIDTDVNNNLFSTGYTNSINYPLQNNGTFFQGIVTGIMDFSILKFDNSGTLLWSTYYGGSDIDVSYSITTDALGNIFVTGLTQSSDFPTQNSGTFFQNYSSWAQDVIILKFDNNGNRLWATYYGGIGDDVGYSITTDVNGNVFVTGYTGDPNFPTLNSGSFFQASLSGLEDVFILKFDNNGNRLWATFYGGSGKEIAYAITTDMSGNVFVTGFTESINFPTQNNGTFFQGALSGGGGNMDAFILKFDNTGNRLWATYYGGTGNDQANTLITDASGNVFISGHTLSTNFPTQNAGTFFQGTNGGGSDAFILKFGNNGNRIWSTYYGGSGDELYYNYNIYTVANLAIDGCGNIYLCLITKSTDITTQSYCGGGYFDNTNNSITPSPSFRIDQFIILFSNSGVLLWATFFGGDGVQEYTPIAIDSNNNLFVSGAWTIVANQSSYPLINPAGTSYYTGTYSGSNDGFFAKFIPTSPITSTQTNPTSCSCNGVATISITACPPLNYYWSNGTTTLNTTATTSSIGGLCAGVHQVTITSTCSFTQMVTFTLTGVGSSLTPNITVTNASCTTPTGTVTLNSVTGGAPNYTITEGAATIATNVNVPYAINGVSLGLHTYLLTDATGCSTTFTANISSSAFSVTANSSPSSTLTCNTSTVLLSTSGALTYTWSGPGIVSGGSTASVTVNSSGIYTVTATDASGCVATTTIAVTQNIITPTITASNTETLTCGTTTLTLTGTGGGTYNWSGPGIISGSTTANPIVNQAGVYSLTVTGTSGCSATASTTVVQNMVTPIATASNTETLTCGTTTLTLTGTGGGTYNWSGPGIVSGGTTANPTVNLPGVYSLTVTSANSCTAVASTTVVQISSIPTLTLSQDVTIIAGSQTQLMVTGNGTNYSWSPNTNLSCITCTNPIASPLVTTNYCALTSVGSCTAQACVLVNVEVNCNSNKEYAIPNAFSPNADGYNDEFCLQGWKGCVTGFLIMIYDRWGEKVYESVDENFCWDGIYKGQLLNPAVFVYYIQATIENIGSVAKKGNITLIR